MEINDKEFKEYLKTRKCNGCYNKCSLSSPRCGKSRVFIKYEREEYLKKMNIEE